MAELFTRVAAKDDLPVKCRHWIGNDQNGHHHHGKVPRQDNVLGMHLSWKATARARPRIIGFFRLNIDSLLEAGYVRSDGPDHVRLRFAHAVDENELHPCWWSAI